jgi:integrase
MVLSRGAAELCDLKWQQVELDADRLHVRRVKNGSPSVHRMQGDEIRALRRLQREQEASSYVFSSERGGPMTPKAFHGLFARIGERAGLESGRAHQEGSPGVRVIAKHFGVDLVAAHQPPLRSPANSAHARSIL